MIEPSRPQLIECGEGYFVVDELNQRCWFPKYRYEPLPEGRLIRLLQLRDGVEPWPLSPTSKMNEFVLMEYELESMEYGGLDVSMSPYVPVSYSWGEPKFDHPLILQVNGQRMILAVTASAWEAVQRVLPAIAAKQKTLWVDQICINQKGSQTEKARQVQLMGEIYRRGWHCIIWLGPASSGSPKAYALLDQLHQIFDPRVPILFNERELAGVSRNQIRARGTELYGEDLLPSERDPGWLELARLLQRSWFTRLWTFQEAVLSYKGDASICCGSNHIDSKTFNRACLFLGTGESLDGPSYLDGRASVARIGEFRSAVEQNRIRPLIWVLQNNDIRQCFLEVDRIYGLLGICKEDGPDFNITVSYDAVTASDLYERVARMIIKAQSSLRIIADAPERADVCSLPRLPSWAPDWSRRRLTTAFEWLDPTATYFRSSGDRRYVENVMDQGAIVARGMIVDTVLNVLDVQTPENASIEAVRLKLYEYILPSLQTFLEFSTPGRDSQAVAHAIIKTITVDGFSRASSLGATGLQPAVITPLICAEMLSYVAFKSWNRALAVPAPTTNVEDWFTALAREAIQLQSRRFASLKHHQFGLMPQAVRPDDHVVILHGSSLPLVLRSQQEGAASNRYTLIGPCFVDGLMYGEKVNWTTGNAFFLL